MYYISLDLEWNQAYAEKLQAVQKRLGARLRGEVIQIGAVKLSEKMRICGSYSVIVRPQDLISLPSTGEAILLSPYGYNRIKKVYAYKNTYVKAEQMGIKLIIMLKFSCLYVKRYTTNSK